MEQRKIEEENVEREQEEADLSKVERLKVIQDLEEKMRDYRGRLKALRAWNTGKNKQVTIDRKTREETTKRKVNHLILPAEELPSKKSRNLEPQSTQENHQN
jgi:hypothetical protein